MAWTENDAAYLAKLVKQYNGAQASVTRAMEAWQAGRSATKAYGA